MKGVVIASHGEMANGVLDTSKLFFGDQEQLKAVCIHDGENVDEYKELLRQAIKDVDTGEGVIAICDMLFGTPCNCLAGLLGEGMENVDVITGLNLPMILQVLAARAAGDVDIQDLIQEGLDGIKNLKEVLAATADDEDE